MSAGSIKPLAKEARFDSSNNSDVNSFEINIWQEPHQRTVWRNLSPSERLHRSWSMRRLLRDKRSIHDKKLFPIASLVLLLIPFILTSCITGSRRAPLSGERQSRKVVETKREEKSVRKVTSSAEIRQGSERKREPVAREYGEITANSVNIRAGASINYEILMKLNNGDKVSIVGSAFGWHEIELPPSCFGWIHSDYASVQNMPSAGGRVAGIVTGNSVRIRTRPGLKCSVLAQVNKSDKLVVIDLEGDWFKIELPENCTGWVYSDYIRIFPR